MEVTVMIRNSLKIFVGLAIVFMSVQASADTIAVTYEIGPSPDGLGGFSGSWLHSADGCEGDGPDSGGTLYMCPGEDGVLFGLSGVVEGTFDTDTGILTITGGMLDVFEDDTVLGTLDILGGMLGGDFSDSGDLNWSIIIEEIGAIFFEDIGFAGGPNQFDLTQLILWGQNREAYCGADCQNDQDSDAGVYGWGIDLYGNGTVRATVPEPGTLALLGLGLLGMGAARRAKNRRA